jgi:hypothetical protein
MRIGKRYSEFDRLRERIMSRFPEHVNEIPELPPKSLVSRFRSSFLNQRQSGLEYFLQCILLNPSFASSDIVKEFIKT